MRKYIDSSGKANEIKMLLNHPSYKNKIFIVLEGQTDIRLFRSLLKSNRVSIESVDGKLDLIAVVKDLRESGFCLIIGVCDADFDHLFGLEEQRQDHGVYLTDVHDAEIMLFDSPSLEAFVDECSNHQNHQELTVNLRKSVLAAAYNIGIVRMLNHECHFNLCFKGLNFNSFVNIERLDIRVDIDQLILDVLRRSKEARADLSLELISKAYNQKLGEIYCPLQVCCGHDVANITAMVYSQRWASCLQNINKDKVESYLRIGYTYDYFKGTRLYQKLSHALASFGIELDDDEKSGLCTNW